MQTQQYIIKASRFHFDKHLACVNLPITWKHSGAPCNYITKVFLVRLCTKVVLKNSREGSGIPYVLLEEPRQCAHVFLKGPRGAGWAVDRVENVYFCMDFVNSGLGPVARAINELGQPGLSQTETYTTHWRRFWLQPKMIWELGTANAKPHLCNI